MRKEVTLSDDAYREISTVFKLLSKTLYYIDIRKEYGGSLELSA